MKKLFSIIMSVFLIMGCMIFPTSPVVDQAQAATPWGIDVSEHQGRINWDQVKASGCSFAIIRCGFGQDQAGQDDDYWEYNSSECERVGIPYGTYIYSYAKSESAAIGEANHVLRLIKGKNLSYPVYYDLEESSQASLGSAALGRIATAFCDKIEGAGYSVGVYANTSWWNNYLTASCFNNWYRWVAQYASSCQYKGRYEIWQYTDKRSVPGISGGVDANYQYADVGNSGGAVEESLTTDKSTYAQGEPIYVTASTATSDAWVAIYGADDDIVSGTQSYFWYWVNGTDNLYGHGGTWYRGQKYNIFDSICSHRIHPNGTMIATGSTLPPGKYKVAVLYGDYQTLMQKSITITDSKTPYLEVAKTTFAQGEDIKVKAYGDSDDSWVGIFPGSDPVYDTGSYIYYYYTKNYNDTYVNLQSVGTKNESHAKKDLPPGTYTMTLFGDDGYGDKEASKTITIKGDALVTDKTSYSAGDPIYVTANCTSGGSWVGLYKKGETPGDIDSLYWYYVYTDGIDRNGQTIELTDSYYYNSKRGGSLTAGTYSVKLFGDGGYTNVVKSIDITISKKVSKVETKAATCTATGTKTTYYTDGSKDVVTLSKIDHLYTQKVVTAPSCTEKGFTTYTCSSCKTTKKSDYTNATGHYRPKGVAECKATNCSACGAAMAATKNHTAGAAATCISPQICTVCNTQLAAKTGIHVPGAAATCTTPQKCTTPGCGQIITPATDHTPGPAATCTTPQVCITPGCGAVLDTRGGHTPGAAATCTTPQTCTACSTELEPAKGHKPVAGEKCTDPHKCSVCGEQQSEGKPHTPGPAATCDAPQTCTVCSFEIAPKLEHDMEPATCTKLSYCKNKDCEYTEGELADHVTVIDKAVEPGCLSMGLTQGSHCDVCKEILKQQQIVQATGHDMAEATCNQPAKCKNAGCGYTEGTNLEHEWLEGQVITEASCTTNGSRVDTCNHGCGETKTTILPALGHKYVGTVTPPTCEEDGYTTYICHNGCEDTYTEDYVKAQHTPGPAATCTSPQTCTVPGCGAILEGMKEHVASNVTSCTSMETCTVCHAILAGAKGHTPGPAATCTAPQTCTVEGCDYVFEEIVPHTPGPEATCTTPQVCTAPGCDYVIKPATGHKAGPEATCTTPQTCTECHTILNNIVGHTPGEVTDCETPVSCTVCHSVIMAAAGHDIKVISGYEATCTSEGLSDSRECLTCGKVFAQATTISKRPHNFVEEITPAKLKKDGKVEVKCTECDRVSSSTEIPKIKSIKMSSLKVVYNGKVRNPYVIAKDTSGYTLIADKDFIVTKPAGRKDVGQYQYTVEFIGNYAGTSKFTLTIKPNEPTLLKMTRAKKAVTVKWQKAIKEGTGYQVMVSTSKNFKTAKTVWVKKNSKKSVKVTGLKSKKTYYAKVRAYKTVTINGKATKMYSEWSNIRSIKTK